MRTMYEYLETADRYYRPVQFYDKQLRKDRPMQDSGKREKFGTGAVRDTAEGKPRPDLMSPHVALRVGDWLRKGAEKYAERNWEAGIPISRNIASLERHLAAFKLGLRDEDHMAAICTNAGFILHFEEEIKAGRLPKSLDDMPHYVDRPAVERNHMAELFETVNAGFAAAVAGHPMNWEATLGEEPAYCHEGGVIDNHRDEYPPNSVRPFTVYLCGPITGRDIDWEWRFAARRSLESRGVQTLSPLRGKLSNKIGNQGLSYDGKLANPEMGNRDFQDVKDCDVVLAHFPYMPPRQSIGSLMEMGMAHALGKRIVLSTKLQVFNEHLFCRNFCNLWPDFDKALEFTLALAGKVKV